MSQLAYTGWVAIYSTAVPVKFMRLIHIQILSNFLTPTLD